MYLSTPFVDLLFISTQLYLEDTPENTCQLHHPVKKNVYTVFTASYRFYNNFIILTVSSVYLALFFNLPIVCCSVCHIGGTSTSQL